MERIVSVLVCAVVALGAAVTGSAEAADWTITPITNNEYNDMNPYASDSYVVWQGFDGNDDEIFFYDGETVTQLTDNDVQDELPQVSGRNVAWLRGSGDHAEIFFYDGETTTQLTDNDYRDLAPQLSGSTVVWQRWRGLGPGEIYTWTAPETDE